MTRVQVEPAPSLTLTQQSAVARLAYAIESPGAVALLCGPRGVGKTLVLTHVAASRSRAGLAALCCTARDGVPPPADAPEGIVFVDDAHLVEAGELAAMVSTWRRRSPTGGLVLAGEGRLLTLVARDERLEQAVALRAVLGPFTLAESTAALAPLLAAAVHVPDDQMALVRTIHEIAGGIPAEVARLASFVRDVAAAAPGGRLTPNDVEAVHRRLSPRAA
jgi:hypothetical protein